MVFGIFRRLEGVKGQLVLFAPAEHDDLLIVVGKVPDQSVVVGMPEVVVKFVQEDVDLIFKVIETFMTSFADGLEGSHDLVA